MGVNWKSRVLKIFHFSNALKLRRFIFSFFFLRSLPIKYRANGQSVKKSSFSDGTSYVKVCEICLIDNSVYTNFRRYQEYREILEHVTYKQGLEYLAIAKNTPNYKSFFENGKSINDIGNPVNFYYPRIGISSPTTLRYLKVLCDLITIFGDLNRKSISEIGVGFGGQAHMIMCNFNVNQYRLYDLSPVNKLAQKVLNDLGIKSRMKFIDDQNLIYDDSDIVISNYAFSELTRATQNLYLENVILKSKSGYITWNDISEKYLDGYSLSEFTSLIPNARVFEENPLTAKNNKIIVWLQ